jgi:hypothetical protein
VILNQYADAQQPKLLKPGISSAPSGDVQCVKQLPLSLKQFDDAAEKIRSVISAMEVSSVSRPSGSRGDSKAPALEADLLPKGYRLN